MKLTITIQMDNAAFTDNSGAEVARILREFADRSEDETDSSWDNTYSLRDINGNKVGTAEIETDDDE